MKKLWKAINIFIYADTYTLIHIHIHIHIYIHIYMLVEEGEEGRDKQNLVTTDSLRSVPQDC